MEDKSPIPSASFIVFRDSVLALEVMEALLHVPGDLGPQHVVDPRRDLSLSGLYALNDLVVMGGEEWLTLWRRYPAQAGGLRRRCMVIVVASNGHLLDILAREGRPTGLIVKPAKAPVLSAALAVAIQGHAVMSPAPFEALRHNSQRRAIANGFGGRELAVFNSIARGAPNEQIATDLDLPLSEIKMVVVTLMRRLRLSKRLMLAVFGVEQRLEEERPHRTL